MQKTIQQKFRISIFCVLFTSFLGCTGNSFQLENTKWRVISITLDSVNALNKTELGAAKIADNLLKTSSLYSEFRNHQAITHFEGKIPDTTDYLISRDTLFYIQEKLRDTEIIIKMTKEELITKSLSGICSHAKRIH